MLMAFTRSYYEQSRNGFASWCMMFDALVLAILCIPVIYCSTVHYFAFAAVLLVLELTDSDDYTRVDMKSSRCYMFYVLLHLCPKQISRGLFLFFYPLI